LIEPREFGNDIVPAAPIQSGAVVDADFFGGQPFDAAGEAKAAADAGEGAEPVAQQGRIKTTGYAAQSATSQLSPFSFERRTPGPQDIQIDILYCGVCHSDLHTARNEWTNTTYPVVPGHEIIGRVANVGSQVGKFKPGDLAAVGCLVDSDRACPACKAPVVERDERLVCTQCGRRYPIRDGIPVMLVEESIEI
jgi:threonine dehydrogenase-like Zn-dependent dehydrogenase